MLYPLEPTIIIRNSRIISISPILIIHPMPGIMPILQLLEVENWAIIMRVKLKIVKMWLKKVT